MRTGLRAMSRWTVPETLAARRTNRSPTLAASHRENSGNVRSRVRSNALSRWNESSRRSVCALSLPTECQSEPSSNAPSSLSSVASPCRVGGLMTKIDPVHHPCAARPAKRSETMSPSWAPAWWGQGVGGRLADPDAAHPDPAETVPAPMAGPPARVAPAARRWRSPFNPCPRHWRPTSRAASRARTGSWLRHSGAERNQQGSKACC
jgi:hypothetical protein